MFHVKDFMTKEVITTEPDAKISQIIDLMKIKNIHRLPVIDANGKLVGIITEGMISGADNSATSLSIYELNYLLSKTNVETLMIKKVIAIEEDRLMEEAAQMMLENDIGCLPVVNRFGQVTGILTQNDIFKSFLNVLGWEKKGSRITLEAKDEIGGLEKIANIFANHNVNIYNVGVYESKNGIASMLIRSDAVDLDEMRNALINAGFNVLEAELSD